MFWLCKAVEQNRPVDAQIGQFPHRELDEDPLVLGADDLDLGYVGNEQEPGTDVLDVVAQLPTGEPIGGEAIDDAERVAEPIVEERADRAGRQGVADIRHQVADLIPGVLHVRSRNRLLQVDEDRRHARRRRASQEVEARCFLELPLEPFRDLRQGILHRRARPRRGDDHRLDDEGGILIAAETVEGQEAGSDRHDHEIDHDGAVSQGQSRQVEVHCGSVPGSFTDWPSRRRLAPAVTTMSPAASPFATRAVAGSAPITSRLRQATLVVPGSTTHTPLSCPRRTRAVEGIANAVCARAWRVPETAVPSLNDGGGSVRPTRTAKVRVTGSACGAISRTRPWTLTFGSLARLTTTSTSGSCRTSQVGRDLEDGIATIAPCELHDHPAGCDHLAWLRTDCRDHAGRIGLQGGEPDDVLCRPDAGLGPVHLCLRRRARLFGGLEIGSRRDAALEEMTLPLILVVRLPQGALRRRQCRPRGAQLVELVLRVETCDHLSLTHRHSDAGRPFDQPAAQPERQGCLVLGFDMARETDIR